MEGMAQPKYKRVLLKLSGEAFTGGQPYGVDIPTIDRFAAEIKRVAVNDGVQVGIVVGGGNIWRGEKFAAVGMDRPQADYAGMLATIINGLALQDGIERAGAAVRVMTALTIVSVAEPYIRRRAIHHLEKGYVVIFAAGTGNPFVTTDTAAALRALEIEADVILMAKNGVDGIYNADPRKNSNAHKYVTLNYAEALEKRLKVMDSTTFSLCMDYKMPIMVFDLNVPGNIERAVRGEDIGTLVYAGPTVTTQSTHSLNR